MRVWRITRRAFASSPLDGEGARRFGGRWNRRGVAVAYASATLSLAALEYFVNVDRRDVPVDLVALPVEIPEGLAIEEIDPGALPADWRAHPAPESLQVLGTDWARSGRTAVLRVPSAVIPIESNVLINPSHPDSRRIAIGLIEAFAFDPRMWGGPAS